MTVLGFQFSEAGEEQEMQPMAHDWLTVPEAAEWLRISKSALYEKCRKGIVPCLKLGGTYRINKRALIELGLQAKPE